MKKNNKSVFFIVSILILSFAASTLFGFSTYFGDIETVRIKGVKDIRLGIDIQGGVDVTFKPEGDTDVSESQLKVATEVMKARLVSLNINDSEVYNDTKNDRIIVRFPWQAGEKNFDPEAAVKELGDTAELTFRIGDEYDTDEEGNITPKGEIVLRGADINTASNGPATEEEGGGYLVQLKLNDSGKEKFAKATAQLAGSSTPLSIWLDDEMISAPTVKEALTQGTAVITGNFTYESSKLLADKINSGALPFNLETVSFKTISPTMGQGSLDAMILAGIIAIAFCSIF